MMDQTLTVLRNKTYNNLPAVSGLADDDADYSWFACDHDAHLDRIRYYLKLFSFSVCEFLVSFEATRTTQQKSKMYALRHQLNFCAMLSPSQSAAMTCFRFGAIARRLSCCSGVECP